MKTGNPVRPKGRQHGRSVEESLDDYEVNMKVFGGIEAGGTKFISAALGHAPMTLS